jgi:hypothetical protein
MDSNDYHWEVGGMLGKWMGNGEWGMGSGEWGMGRGMGCLLPLSPSARPCGARTPDHMRCAPWGTESLTTVVRRG